MDIYTFDIFSKYWISVESVEGPARYNFIFDHLKIGPLNLPEAFHLEVVKGAVLNILSLSIPSTWCTGFSTWVDFNGLLRTGTKLPVHTVVLATNRKLGKIDSGSCIIDHVSQNGDISIELHEDFPTL